MQILASLRKFGIPENQRILGVTAVDLYIPTLTFVFGEAPLRGTCAVVSFHRLAPGVLWLAGEFGGLAGAFVKKAVHELGHTLPLAHCQDYQCVMSPSHVKTSQFCNSCRRLLTSNSAELKPD